MLRFKGIRGDVRVGFLEAPIVEVLNQAAIWSARYGSDVIITSMNDHDHTSRSLHYKNLAVDLQVFKGPPPNTSPSKPALVLLDQHLRGALGLGFDVVFDSPGHYNHIHIEWDIRQRKSEPWRPTTT
jgi:hypothetical protein